MEMKPQYSYGTISLTSITFTHQHVAQNPTRAFYLAREFVPSLYKDMTFKVFMSPDKHPYEQEIVGWTLNIQEDIDYILGRFEWAGIQPDVVTQAIAILYDDFDFNIRLGKDTRHLPWAISHGFSHAAMNEFLFEKWIAANDFTEAYRCKASNTYGYHHYIRVWDRDHKIYAISKQFHGIGTPLEVKYYRIPAEPWFDFKVLMEKFWTIEPWEEQPNSDMVTISRSYLSVEGWREGTYKTTNGAGIVSGNVVSVVSKYDFSLMLSKSREVDKNWQLYDE